eukprot:g11288.t1
MEEDKGSRFGHLLKPIRDLATNWNIDIATELEEYLSELESIVITFDDGETNFNFAEAALLIQGSACVYSKKVEYLYGLLYKTLDVLIQKRTRDRKQESSVGSDGIDEDMFFDEEPLLLPLDDVLKESKNIDLVEKGSTATTKDRASNRVTRLRNTLLATSQNEEGDDGDSFALSNCIVHESGALLVEAREASFLDNALDWSRSKTELPFGSPAVFLEKMGLGASTQQHTAPHTADREPAQQDPTELAGLEPVAEMCDDEAADHSFEPSLDLGDAESAGGDDMDTHASPNPRAARQQHEGGGDGASQWEQEDEEPDPYELCDPHSTEGPKARPFAKGRTYTVPRSHKSSPTSEDYMDMLAQSRHPLFESLADSIDKGSIKSPYFAEFIYLFLSEASNRRNTRRKEKRESIISSAKKNPVLVSSSESAANAHEDEDEEERGLDGNDGSSFAESALDFEVNQWGDQPDLVGADQLPETDELLRDYKDVLETEASAVESAESATYDELCRRHVEAYMKSSEAFLTETALMKRVSQWEEKLLPILKAEDERVVFDINTYGNSVLARLSELSLHESATNSDMVHGFDQVVAGREKFDISRIFLATLQMANEYNLEIVPQQTSKGSENSVQTFSLKLLREKRTRAMDDFIAPSIQAKVNCKSQPTVAVAKKADQEEKEDQLPLDRKEKENQPILAREDNVSTKKAKRSRRSASLALGGKDSEPQKKHKAPHNTSKKAKKPRKQVQFSETIQVKTYEEPEQ